MKQIILKELREQFKVALVAALVLIAMLFLYFRAYGSQILQIARNQGGMNSDSLQPLMRSEVLMQVSFFCAIFGALLGGLQIWSERHPDLWAFLVHRPIRRVFILRGKIVAGLLLYAAGAGLPLLGFVILLSRPGKVAAPFAWSMALPITAVFLAGTVSYFAGLLIGLRKARWYGSRCLSIGLVVIVYASLFGVPEFWQALLIVAAAVALLALAVQGCFQTGGYYRGQSGLAKAALILTMALSATVLLGLLLSFVVNIFITRDYTHSHYQILRDGRVVKITQHGYDDAEIVDLNGQPILDEKTGRKIEYKDMGQRFAVGLSALMNNSARPWPYQKLRGSFLRTARFFSAWRVQDKVIWYLTADGKLAGYNALTRQFAGTLAPSGAASATAPDDSHFLRPQNYSYGYLNNGYQPGVLASARTAYFVDLGKRELRPIFTAPEGDAIGGFSDALAQFQTIPPLTLILTRQSVNLLDITGQIHLQRPYVPSAPEYSSVIIHTLNTNQGFVVQFGPDYFANQQAGGKLLTHVDWVNNDGTLRDSIDLLKLPEPQNGDLAEKIMLPLVPLIFPIYIWDEPYRVWNALRIVPAILCVGLGCWLGRRHRFTRGAQVGWGIFHLLFGLPGLLAFIAVQEWPAKTPCARCGKLRVINRDSCEHCGAASESPEKTGTEIFEPLTTT